jgi:hypothetical protein
MLLRDPSWEGIGRERTPRRGRPGLDLVAATKEEALEHEIEGITAPCGTADRGGFRERGERARARVV